MTPTMKLPISRNLANSVHLAINTHRVAYYVNCFTAGETTYDPNRYETNDAAVSAALNLIDALETQSGDETAMITIDVSYTGETPDDMTIAGDDGADYRATLQRDNPAMWDVVRIAPDGSETPLTPIAFALNSDGEGIFYASPKPDDQTMFFSLYDALRAIADATPFLAFDSAYAPCCVLIVRAHGDAYNEKDTTILQRENDIRALAESLGWCDADTFLRNLDVASTPNAASTLNDYLEAATDDEPVRRAPG